MKRVFALLLTLALTLTKMSAQPAFSVTPGNPLISANSIVTTPASVSNDVSRAVPGQTVVFSPGTYTNNNLLKKGVNYYMLPGARFEYYCSQTNSTAAGYGIFDDRGCGATTNIIDGYGEIIFSPGTNYSFTDDCDPGYMGNAFSLGGLVVTNPLTLANWHFAKGGAWGIAGGVGNPIVLTVKNCQNGSVFSVDYLYNAAPFNSTTLTNCAADPGTGYTENTISVGISWGGQGNPVFRFHRIETNFYYGINWTVSGVANDDANAYVQGDFCGSTIYGVGDSYNYRMWFNILEITPIGSPSTVQDAVGFYGQGKYYLTAQKIQSTANAIVSDLTGSNVDIYVSAQKITSTGSWLVLTAPTTPAVNGPGKTVRLTSQHFTPLGSSGGGFTIGTNTTVEINTMDARSDGVVLTSSGGLVLVNGGTLQSTNAPVIKLNANSGGLHLKGVTLLTGAGSNAIYASAALLANGVQLYNGAANATNIAAVNSVAVTNGSWTVNANVK